MRSSREIRFCDTELDESPNTIAYALLALSSVAFEYEIGVIEDADGEIIVMYDEASGFEYVRMRVSPLMGTLLISILDRAGEELAATADGDEPWISKN